MKTKFSPLVSIIIVNYNNKKYLKNCLNSVLKKSYLKKEIILFDDQSNDGSDIVINKFKKKIKLIKSKKRTSFGSYNQMNGYYKGSKFAKGSILFFLDSDDYFVKNKIETIVEEFRKSKKDIIFDLPIILYSSKNKHKFKFFQRKFNYTSWPRFTPQSCISIKKNQAIKAFKQINVMKFPNIWLDFRIALYFFLKNKNIKIFYKNLTFYRQLNNSASKKFKTFSRDWWIRRDEAHDFYTYLTKKLKLKNKLTLDKIITKLVKIFIIK